MRTYCGKRVVTSLSVFVGACVAFVPVAASAANTAEALDGALAIKSQDAVVYVPVQAVTASVAWAESPLRVDGDLGDWKKCGIEPQVFADAAHASWFKGVYRGKDDLSVALHLGRDDNFLYVAMEIGDDGLPPPERIEIGIAPANSPLITTWRDVGMRYGADDVHAVFGVSADGAVSLRWAHIQQRMDSAVIANSFGTEAERLAFIEQGAAEAADAKIFSKARRQTHGHRSVTCFEAAIPWKMLAPYDPVSYAPLNFNFTVSDTDAGAVPGRGVIGWKPGLAGTYSAAHFATLSFEPPAGRTTVDAYAQLPRFHYLNEKIATAFSFFNHGTAARSGTLELWERSASATGALATAAVSLPPGFSQKDLAVHSEAVGKTNCGFRALLKLEGQPAQELSVHVPTLNNIVTIQPLSEVEAAITGLETDAKALSNLYAQVEAKGLETTYPLAYLTLQQMFIARCRADLRGGDSRRVLNNTAYLAKLFDTHKARLEEILQNPAAQLKAPPRMAPEKLVLKDGYYHADGHPVFLWGPCTFWWMRNDQHYAWKLGFNSVGPELPVHSEKDRPALKAYLEAFRTNGLLVNAAIGNAQFDALKKEHPEVANVDRNNFLPILIQHPIARQEIIKRFQADIGFYREFPAVRSYWLWNEPDYVNYSEMTRRDFIEQYLKPQYKNIEALNARWKSAFKSFDEVTLPKDLDPANHAPWYDYQRFRDDLLADFFGFLDKTAKGIDPSRPTHTKYMCISAGFFNMERLQGLNDIAGHDGNSSDRDIIFLDLCKSLYPAKPLVNTEIHIWYKDWLMVAMVPWRLALHGLADGNWWCWHANARFSNSVGSAESMDALALAGLDVRRLFDPYIHALNVKAKPVATLYPDIVAGRSWGAVDRLRYEIAPAQYALGLQPFYATETRISQGELAKHKLLVACESDFVKQSTYKEVLEYVRGGGTVIVLPGGFAHNEYGDPRDAGALIPKEGGEAYCEGARAHALGKGRVICIEQLDGTDAAAKPDARKRQAVYRRVLARAMADAGIEDPVRLVAAASDPDALYGMDVRCAEVADGFVLAALPYGRWEPSSLELAANRPVKRIVNLITGREVAANAFKVALGPNLFLIELTR